MSKNYTVLCSIALFLFTFQSIKAEISVSTDEVEAFKEMESEALISLAPIPHVPRNEVDGVLINGRPVDPLAFPAIFRMTTGGTCTASLVGPSTMFFAAHCIDHDYQRITFTTAGKTVIGICIRAENFKKDGDQDDWALCLLKNKVTGIKYESIDIKTKVNLGDKILLTGYGCTEEGSYTDKKLRFGESIAKDVPAYFNWKKEASTVYVKGDYYGEGAIICPGDSGGPAFRLTGLETDKRFIIGVNSRTTYKEGYSLLSATASEAGKRFINNWITTKQQKICGVNLNHPDQCQ